MDSSSTFENSDSLFQRRGSPEKRRFPEDDDSLEKNHEKNHEKNSEFGEPALLANHGNTKTKRPNLNLDSEMGQDLNADFAKESFRNLLKTNVRSLYSMAKLSGVTRKEFLDIVNTACD